MDILISNPKEEIKYTKFGDLAPGEIFLFAVAVKTFPPNDRAVFMCGQDYSAISLHDGYISTTPKDTMVYKITKYKFEYETP